jgi:hypothetical protein
MRSRGLIALIAVAIVTGGLGVARSLDGQDTASTTSRQTGDTIYSTPGPAASNRCPPEARGAYGEATRCAQTTVTIPLRPAR